MNQPELEANTCDVTLSRGLMHWTKYCWFQLAFTSSRMRKWQDIFKPIMKSIRVLLKKHKWPFTLVFMQYWNNTVFPYFRIVFQQKLFEFLNRGRLLQILHCMFLMSAQIDAYLVNLATFRKACTASISICNLLQSTAVAREQSFILNMPMLLYIYP